MMLLRAAESLAVGELHVVPAAQRSGGLAKIDRHLLAPPGTDLPQLGGREPARSHCRRTGRADAERRRQHGVGATGERDLRGMPVGPTGDRQDRAKSFIRHGHDRSGLQVYQRNYARKPVRWPRLSMHRHVATIMARTCCAGTTRSRITHIAG